MPPINRVKSHKQNKESMITALQTDTLGESISTAPSPSSESISTTELLIHKICSYCDTKFIISHKDDVLNSHNNLCQKCNEHVLEVRRKVPGLPPIPSLSDLHSIPMRYRSRFDDIFTSSDEEEIDVLNDDTCPTSGFRYHLCYCEECSSDRLRGLFHRHYCDYEIDPRCDRHEEHGNGLHETIIRTTYCQRTGDHRHLCSCQDCIDNRREYDSEEDPRVNYNDDYYNPDLDD